MESKPGLLESGPPARHYGSGRHRPAEDGIPKRRSWAGRGGRLRPQFLAAAAVALVLIPASTLYLTPVQVSLRTAAGESAPASPSEAAAGQRIPAVPAPAEETAAALPEGVPAGASASQGEPAAAGPDAGPAAPAGAASISPELDARINAIIAANSRYRLGVALIDVADGTLHGYGAQEKFVAASTGKILAAVAYYNLVERGQASLAASLGSSTADGQIRQMVQQSNNTSWELILGVVGRQGLRNYAASIGIDYDRTLNTLTPAEMARTLELLYAGKLLNAEHTRQLLSYMQDTNFETLIPAAVPPQVGVFHKYGLLLGNLHDAGVLTKGGRAYVFVVYTLGRSASDMEDRARVIRDLTKTVAAGLF